MSGPVTLLLWLWLGAACVGLWVAFDRWLDRRRAFQIARRNDAAWSALVLQVQRAREDFAPPANGEWTNRRWEP